MQGNINMSKPLRVAAKASVALAVGVALAGRHSPAQAQESVLEEIIVSAQKREQKLSDVGISITAFSGDQMKDLGISSTTDISSQTPGLIVTEFGSGTTSVFNVRGSGQLDFNDQQEAPVAVYLDGAYVSFLAGVGFNFFDLDRVEVLRGSQGTLFGRNATGGLVQIISRKPGNEFDGYVEATAGEYGLRKAETAINVPFSETAAARLSLYHEESDGYIKNSTGPNGGIRNNNSGRLQFQLKPRDDLSILLAGRWAIDDAAGQVYDVHAAAIDAGGYIQRVSPFGPASTADFVNFCAGMTAVNGVALPPGGTNPDSGDCFNGALNSRGPFVSSTDYPSFFKRNHYGSTATVDYSVGPGTLTSVTDYQDFKKRYSEDGDSTPLSLWGFQQDLDATQGSEELRYAAETGWGRYVLGGYALQIESRGRASLDAVNSIGLAFENFFRLRTNTYAAFAQAEYNLAPTVVLIVGGRWTEDRKRFSVDARCGFDLIANARPTADNCAAIPPFATLVQGSGLAPTSRSEGNWSGNVELDWKPNGDLLIYGKVVRGYKAGGFNGGITNLFEFSKITYNAETPTTFEVGAKSSLLDGKVRLNASAFYMDYRNFQTFTQVGAGLLQFNVDARSLGGEAELVINPVRGLDLLLGMSLLDAKQKHVAGPGGELDRPMPNAPRVTYNALARYSWPVPGGAVALQADMNHRGKRSLGAIDHPALVGAAYTVVNASVEWSSVNERWSAMLWAKNLTDEVYFPTTFDLSTITGQMEDVVAPPRWFGATLTYRFK